MLLYRVLRKAYAKILFDGQGAFLFGGRWSSPGVRLSYASEHQSLAMLEYFVHLDSEGAPSDLVLAVAELPDELAVEQITAEVLPPDWRDSPAPPSLSEFGNSFVKRGEHVAMAVPSALAPSENNLLINPAHAHFGGIVMKATEALRYDTRMFRPRHSSRKKK